MATQEDAKPKRATTYNAALDFSDDPANSCWQRFGPRTIERLTLSPGARVLDVCCGLSPSVERDAPARQGKQRRIPYIQSGTALGA
jgi:hypothetical protein